MRQGYQLVKGRTSNKSTRGKNRIFVMESIAKPGAISNRSNEKQFQSISGNDLQCGSKPLDEIRKEWYDDTGINIGSLEWKGRKVILHLH